MLPLSPIHPSIAVFRGRVVLQGNGRLKPAEILAPCHQMEPWRGKLGYFYKAFKGPLFRGSYALLPSMVPFVISHNNYNSNISEGRLRFRASKKVPFGLIATLPPKSPMEGSTKPGGGQKSTRPSLAAPPPLSFADFFQGSANFGTGWRSGEAQGWRQSCQRGAGFARGVRACCARYAGFLAVCLGCASGHRGRA